jgi:hypothetical protein
MTSKESERRQRGNFWGLVAALTVTVSSQIALGRGTRAGVERAKVRLTLRVYNYAISHTLLSDAQGEATAILNYAGLEAVWVDCAVTDADVAKHTACNRPIGAAEFILKILTKAQTAQFPKGDDQLGQALDCPKGQGGCSAYVFYSDVRELARADDAPEFRLLGHVIAHEIGHMLLGQNSHSATGIMQADWSDKALRTIARGCLFFTQEESRRMRDALQARNTAQQVKLASAR